MKQNPQRVWYIPVMLFVHRFSSSFNFCNVDWKQEGRLFLSPVNLKRWSSNKKDELQNKKDELQNVKKMHFKLKNKKINLQIQIRLIMRKCETQEMSERKCLSLRRKMCLNMCNVWETERVRATEYVVTRKFLYLRDIIFGLGEFVSERELFCPRERKRVSERDFFLWLRENWGSLK